MAIIKSVSIKNKNDNQISNVKTVELTNDGIKDDIHSDGGNKQISILPIEVINEHIKDKNKQFNPGDYGENFVVEGLDYQSLNENDKLKTGEVSLLITKLGAVDRNDADAMSRHNIIHKSYIFAKVLNPGTVSEGMNIEIEH